MSISNKQMSDFLLALADLLEKYQVDLGYTREDNGIHVTSDEDSVCIGWPSGAATSELRDIANKLI